MTYQGCLLAFTLMGIYSVCSQVEIDPTLSFLACEKCPPGFSSLCPQNGTSLCVPCKEGTFSEHNSRRPACKPCSSCRSNEFESQPCNSTSDVKCEECSTCAPGFWEVKPCERTRDTVCEECPQSGKGIMRFANVQCNEDGIEDRFISMKSKENDKPKGSLTIIEKLIPLSDDKRKPKHDDNFTVAQLNVTASPLGFPSRDQAPTSSLSTKSTINRANRSNSASAHMTLPSHSMLLVSPCVEASSITGLPKSISPSVAPTMPAKWRSPPPPPKLRRTIATEETSEPSSLNEGLELQGQIPKNTNKSKLSRSSLCGIIVVATGVAIVLAVVLLEVRRKQFREIKEFFKCPRPKCRRPRCPAASDCCDGTSVSSIAAANAEQNPMGNHVCHGLPVTVPIEHESDESPPNSTTTTQHTFLPSERTVVVADVHHHGTVFDLFNIPQQVVSAAPARSHLKYITQAKTTINSTGGKLSSPDSDISITVDSGAVPEGINQPFSFGVVYDETSLLRDIPENSDRTLISPLFYCGPDNINLLKPVEIIVPHCLYLDEVKNKDSISVYRCGSYSEDGPLKWEKVPSASERNSQSNAWYTVKKDSVHIKTKTFSFWSIFVCGGGGPKRKRATVFAHKPNEELDTICFRFYIYSDNEDSKKRVMTLCPNWDQMNEVPFKMYNDNKDVMVRLTDLEEGWEMDKTRNTQTYPYETAYHNGFRTYISCEFAVKPSRQTVDAFSCNLIFHQEEHPELSIYLNPGYIPRKKNRRFLVKSSESGFPAVREEDEQDIDDHEAEKPSQDLPANQRFSSLGSEDEPVTQNHCTCICSLVGGKWKIALRYLGVAEVPDIENVDNNYKYVDEKCYQGLLMWSRNCGTQTATTKQLCDALRQAGCSEALEALSKAGVSCGSSVPIPESTTDQPGTSV